MNIKALNHDPAIVTSMRPLQYQKQLRLLIARQMMLAEAIDATQAAYRVDYESRL
ncbi:hypothetical protein [Altericista sp. CCNU0014]|uniref:hypothetical protein n=1 Tax=Altericista sp. CCNU0014 TaxID=3082949 RepID=UPI00384F22D2